MMAKGQVVNLMRDSRNSLLSRVCFTLSTSQFRLATFLVLSSHMWTPKAYIESKPPPFTDGETEAQEADVPGLSSP